MRRTGNPDNTCLWWPCATPRTACLLQAVVLSAVIAVAFQSLLSFFVDVPTLFLHLGGFVVCFLAVWRFQGTLLNWLERPSPVRWVRFGPKAIEGELSDNGQVVAFEVLEVGRFLGAMVIKLQSAHETRGPRLTDFAKTVSITLWQSALGKDLFRKISVLTLWHARRGA